MFLLEMCNYKKSLKLQYSGIVESRIIFELRVSAE